MPIQMQIISLLFSFVMGIIDYFFVLLNYQIVKPLSNLFKVIITSMGLFNLLLLYYYFLLKINNGIFNYYFYFMIVGGIYFGHKLMKAINKTVKKN